MTTSYTANKNLPYPAINDINWGQTLNLSIQDIDQAFGGTGQVTLSSSSGNAINLSNSGSNPTGAGLAGVRIRISGSISQNTSLIIQNNIQGMWVVTIDTGVLGSYTITIKGSASDVGVTLSTAGSTIIYSDGTSAILALPATASGYLLATGNQTFSGNLTVGPLAPSTYGSLTVNGPLTVNTPTGQTTTLNGTVSIPGLTLTTATLSGGSAPYGNTLTLTNGNLLVSNGNMTLSGASATISLSGASSSITANGYNAGTSGYQSSAGSVTLIAGSVTALAGTGTFGTINVPNAVGTGNTYPTISLGTYGGKIFSDFSAGNGYIGFSNPTYTYYSAMNISTGMWYSVSDARIKENVETISNATDKVKKLRGVYYNIIGFTEKSIGLIAQEVIGILPEVVSQPFGDKYAVSYQNIVALLIESNKELEARIAALESKQS